MIRWLMTRPLAQLLLAGGTVTASAAILAVLLYRERTLLLQLDWHFNPALLISAFGLYFVGLSIAGLIWAWLMQGLGSTLPRWTHLAHYGLSHLARRLPGTLWYVASRGYLYKQSGESLRLITFASSIEVFITLVSGSLTSLLFAGYSLSKQTAFPLWGWLLLSAAGLLLLHPRSLHYLMRRFNIATVSSLYYGHLLIWVGLYSLIWMIGGTVLYLVSQTLTPVALAALPYFIGSWSLVGTLSFVVLFLPSNFGFTEVGLSLLLATVMPSSLAVLVAIVNRIFLLLCEIIGIPSFLFFLHLRHKGWQKE